MIRINRQNGGKTCVACPSQWEFDTDDGQVVYIRYRNGAFKASIGPTLDAAIFGQTLVFGDIGDSLDGFMETAEMEDLVKEIIEFYD